MASARARAALAGAVALGLGAAGAWWLFGASAPEPEPAPTPPPTEPERRPAAVRRGVDQPDELEPISRHKVSAELAEARREPAARHAALEPAKWRRVADVLGRKGEDALSTSARDMADALERAQRPMDDDALDQLLIDERRFIFELRNSAVAEAIKRELDLIELGLNAAQQAGIHPADMPREPAPE